jgi:hypothetical protein
MWYALIGLSLKTTCNGATARYHLTFNVSQRLKVPYAYMLFAKINPAI